MINECDICYNESDDLMKTCENNHMCCKKCLKQINICHMCRCPIIDIYDIIYTDLFSTYDVLNNNNLYEYYINHANYGRIYGILSEYDISVLTSAKSPKDYILYNIVDDYTEKITCNSPSIWYKSLDNLSTMIDNSTNSTNGVKIVKINVPCNKVMIDVEQTFNSSKKEVILLSGSYEYMIVNIYNKSITLQDITENNKELILNAKKNSRYYCTIEILKNICRNNRIFNYSKLNKNQLIELIISYNTIHV